MNDQPLSQVTVTNLGNTSRSASATKDHPPLVQPKPGSVFFDDAKRRIDFVLVFEKSEPENNSDKDKDVQSSSNVLKRFGTEHQGDAEREKVRQFFQSNLVNEGLEMEEDVRQDDDGRLTVFLKVHAPWSVLCKQAERLRMKMPLKLRDTFAEQTDSGLSIWDKLSDSIKKFSKLTRKKFAHLANTGSASANNGRPQTATIGSRMKKEPRRLTWQFKRKKLDRFDVQDQSTFFTPIQRMEMVWQILQKARNDPDDEKRRGIEQLLHEGVYEAAYPLHDAGEVDTNLAAPISEWPQRQLLRHTWATWRALFKPQPLELIRSYYGEKIAFYFAFLGFYMEMLVYPGLVGIAALIFGLTYQADDDLANEICNKTGPPGIYRLCPVCEPPACVFPKYNEFCSKAHEATWMDNEVAIVVAILTVAWATWFRKAWKRREAELAFEWDVYEVEQEDIVIRPEYEHRAPETRPNPVTRQNEPYIPRMLKLRWKAESSAITGLMLLAVACTLMGLVIARIKLYQGLKNLGVHENVEASRYIIHGFIFIVVTIFDSAYTMVAEKVTSLECPRTQSEWLSSFLWKVFIFELLNDFIPIAYAAWIKGRMVQTPLDLGPVTELCDPSGCMAEVTELIAILLLARMFVGNAAEIGVPFLKHYVNRFICDTASTTGAVSRVNQKETYRGNRAAQARRPPMTNRPPAGRPIPMKNQIGPSQVEIIGQQTVELEEKRWRSDVLLGELELDGVAHEYMEMMVQLSFCTLFVPALPVAAAVSFLNNILEIRVDAIKIIASHRRPLPARVSGIGIWNDFISCIAKLSVLCNAGLLAFTSDAIVRLYYNFLTWHETGYSYSGFPAWALSNISRMDFLDTWNDTLMHAHGEHQDHEEMHDLQNLQHCYYAGYQDAHRPWHVNEKWYTVWCVRLGAFGIFVAIGFTFQFIFDSWISDIPDHVAVKIQRQRYVLSRAMESEQTYENWLKNHNGQLSTGQKLTNQQRGRSPSMVSKRDVMFRQKGTTPNSAQKFAWK